jgi:hypothetical protein
MGEGGRTQEREGGWKEESEVKVGGGERESLIALD